MSREQTRQFIIDRAQQGDEASIEEIVTAIEGGPPPLTAEQDRSDFLYHAHRFKEDRADLYADGLDQQVNALEKSLIEQAPNLDYATRYRVLSQVADQVLGTPEQRAIRAMDAQRRQGRGEQLREYAAVAQESLDEFEQERAAGEREGIEQLRQGRAGTRLSDIRGKTRTNDT